MRSFVRTLIFILAVAGSGCKKLKVQRVESEKESGSAVSIRNFSRDSFDKEGKLKWKLKAKEAYIFPKENKTVLYSLRFKQFEKEKEQSTILADKGIIDHSIKVVLLNGNIQVDGVEDRKIIAEELHYDLN
ncbi:MAG: LPS export ABC transporter periplasmic protein LptC, partial [Leptospiraceae bacterium]|nr:LPS export ABC transporter periplasmic protein LptC [Leptospiraceae bacterium]